MLRTLVFLCLLFLSLSPVPAQSLITDCKNDWPNLARYREDNKNVAPPAKGEQRVVFMGDSITDSWDNPVYGGFFPGKPYIDREAAIAASLKRRR